MDLLLTAHHEAGHGVAAHVVGHPVQRLSDRNILKEARQETVVSWGGPLAEHHYQPTTVAQRRQLWEKEWIGDRRNLLRVDARVRRFARWHAATVLTVRDRPKHM
jgi:hypothetical protein